VGKAVGEAGRHNSYAEVSTTVPSQAGGLQWLVLTKPKPIGCHLRTREPYNVDDASAGCAGCATCVRLAATRAGRPLELEGEYPEQGQHLAKLRCAQTMQIPTEMHQYEDPPLNNLPGRPSDAETKPSKCNRTPGCVRQLSQNDAIKGLVAGCARLEGECRNTGARPEGPNVETRCLGNVREFLESDL
jgi:hypothetical protein